MVGTNSAHIVIIVVVATSFFKCRINLRLISISYYTYDMFITNPYGATLMLYQNGRGDKIAQMLTSVFVYTFIYLCAVFINDFSYKLHIIRDQWRNMDAAAVRNVYKVWRDISAFSCDPQVVFKAMCLRRSQF